MRACPPGNFETGAKRRATTCGAKRRVTFFFAIFPPVFEFRFDSDASSNLALLGKL